MSREMNKSSSLLSFRTLMGLGSSIFRRGFNSSKCKTEAKLATARIKLLRNKREVQVRQSRRDVALLLQSGQEDTARIRVEHVIREQNVMAANEIIELFCELIVTRLPIIAKQRECPADLKEGISSLIYAALRCSDIPELYRIRDIFEKKYGKDFVSAASDLRPESGVNRMLIEKLSVRKPTGEVKLKVLKEIAKEYQIEWDIAQSELELLKPPDELLEGPSSFVSASRMPVKPTLPVQIVQSRELKSSSFTDGEGPTRHFQDTASAAKAAAESANRAVSAAQAAAYLAQQNSHQSDQLSGSRRQSLNFSQSFVINDPAQAATYLPKQNSHQLDPSAGSQRRSLNSTQNFVTTDPSINELKSSGKIFLNSQSFHGSSYMNGEDVDPADLDDKKILRRNSCVVRSQYSDIKFDDSDGLDSECDEEVQIETNSKGSHLPPPNRPPPEPPRIDQSEGKSPFDNISNGTARVHPKLPDYETLAARFEALKMHRS